MISELNEYLRGMTVDMSVAMLFDGLGLIGAFLHLLGYFLLANRYLTSEQLAYFYINLFAGLFVFASLAAAFNLATLITQGFWIFLSARSILMRKREMESQYAQSEYDESDVIDLQTQNQERRRRPYSFSTGSG